MGIFLTQSCPQGRNVFDWLNLTTNCKTGENCGGRAAKFRTQQRNEPPFESTSLSLEQGEQFSVKWSIVCAAMCEVCAAMCDYIFSVKWSVVCGAMYDYIFSVKWRIVIIIINNNNSLYLYSAFQ